MFNKFKTSVSQQGWSWSCWCTLAFPFCHQTANWSHLKAALNRAQANKALLDSGIYSRHIFPPLSLLPKASSDTYFILQPAKRSERRQLSWNDATEGFSPLRRVPWAVNCANWSARTAQTSPKEHGRSRLWYLSKESKNSPSAFSIRDVSG